MGKNKWFFETEGSAGSAYRASDSPGSGRPKKSGSLPGKYQQERNAHQDGFSILSKSWIFHLKRRWASLRFLSRSVASPVFSKSSILKFGFVAAAAYYLFGGNVELSASLAGSSSRIDWNRETSLGVASEKKRSVTPKKQPVKKLPKSDTAPVSNEQLHGDQSVNYIKKFGNLARSEMKKYGVPASISLAQGLIESRAGTSKLAVNNNNHFGMKCFSRNCRKGHCTNFTDDSHKDFFLRFNQASQSWDAHSRLLSSGRYAKLKKYGRDYRRWAYGLKTVGYATDRTYAEKLIGIIERYDLDQFDR